MGMDRAIEKKKGIRPKHIMYGVGNSLAFILFLVKIMTSSGSSTLRVNGETLTIEEVEYDDFDDFIRTNGIGNAPISTIYLDAEEGGQVKERLIEEGTMVKQGDIILVLENRSLYENIMNSESNLAQKQNMLRQTRISFESQQIESRTATFELQLRYHKEKKTFRTTRGVCTKTILSLAKIYLQAKEDYEYAIQVLEIDEMKARERFANPSHRDDTTGRGSEQDATDTGLN